MMKLNVFYANGKGKDGREKIRKGLFGNAERQGLLTRLLLYALLFSVGFVYVYPILKMLSASLMDPFDAVNPLVDWIPTKLNVNNYIKAFKTLGGTGTLFVTVGVMMLIALAQTLSSAVIAYGFAKFKFRGRNIFFVLMIATFILPNQVTFLPNYVMFKNYGMLHTIMPFLIPSLLGQGVRHAMFILIFYQFYRMSPKALDEAAAIDGAGIVKTFLSINLRMAEPAIMVVYVFSFVWNWNETYLAGSYFGDSIRTLPLALEGFKLRFQQLFPSNFQGTNITTLDTLFSQGIQMAGTILSIAPLILMYVLIERRLIESIDHTGITGE